MSNPPLDLAAEWLEADSQGGFASGTVGGARTRRYHALLLTATTPPSGRAAQRARAAFIRRFDNPGGGLFDVVDVDHVAGTEDARIRPNQILAIGGLPFPILEGDLARLVVDLVEAELLTPFGLRSLSPDDPAYKGRYHGGPAERDGAYHQGTVWPWLLGPFVDAWLAVRGRPRLRRPRRLRGSCLRSWCISNRLGSATYPKYSTATLPTHRAAAHSRPGHSAS